MLARITSTSLQHFRINVDCTRLREVESIRWEQIDKLLSKPRFSGMATVTVTLTILPLRSSDPMYKDPELLKRIVQLPRFCNRGGEFQLKLVIQERLY